MGLTLYVGSKRYSSWSLRPYLALAHAGVTFETKTILLDQATSKDEIAKVNPAGRVPVLYDDKLVIWDSLAICEYAAELAPDAKLWPVDREQRARARSISAEMHAGFPSLRGDMPMDLTASKAGQGHTPEALADARRVMAIWREQLQVSGGPFLFGTFGNADAMFAPVTTRFRTYAVDLDASCRAYVDAVAAVPGMQQWQRDANAEPKIAVTGRVFQLNRSPGGVPKLALREVRIGKLGLDGDDHAHPKHHGGPERAVCLFALEVLQKLQSEGHPIYPGSTGENVTVSGLDWAALTSGTRLELGDEVLIEITKPAEPCKSIAASFMDRNIKRIQNDLQPGEARLYARVLREGFVRVGQAVRVLRPADS